MNAFDVVENILGLVWALFAAHPLRYLVLFAAWLLAETFWKRLHLDPVTRPHLYTRIARSSHCRIEKASNVTEKPHQNFWPLPGGLRVVAEFLYIIGGSGTGKTLRILLYVISFRLIQQERSMWMIDPKGELFDSTRRLLGILGGSPNVYLISTLEKHRKLPRSPINPMLLGEERLNYLRTAIPGSDTTKDSFFDNAAQRLCYRIAEAQVAEWGGTDLMAVYRALDRPEELDRLAQTHDCMASVWRGSDTERGTHLSAQQTALAALFGLELPRIATIFDTRGRETGTWDTSPNFGQRAVGYLCVSPSDVVAAEGLIRAAVDHLMQRAAQAKEQGGPKVDAILEEAGTFGPLEKLNVYVNLLRGSGVNVVVVIQTLDQLRARMGHDNAASAFSAGGCIIWGRMTSPEGGRMLETLAGTTRVPKPREYTPIWLSFVSGVMDGIAHVLSESRDSGRPTGRVGAQGREHIVVPRFPANCLSGFALDPDLQGTWLGKQAARLKLWWTQQ